jgi:U-box domain
MLDPVLDAEGNTFERSAILRWLQENHTSPVSRQPLNEHMLLRNIAMHDIIHETMGEEWVEAKINKNNQIKMTTQTENAFGPACRYQARINAYLRQCSEKMNGIDLSLNEDGTCSFSYDNIVIALQAPQDNDIFCLYTHSLISPVSAIPEDLKDRLLELNFLQGEFFLSSSRAHVFIYYLPAQLS